MSDTKIEWADKVWNPITGCTPVSEGCQNCYARRMAVRFGRKGVCLDGKDRTHHFFAKVLFHPDRLGRPAKWKKPRRIFVNSMGDLFHKDVPDVWQNDVLNVIWKTPQHDFLLLTKRPQNIPKTALLGALPNLWVGVTAENQQHADERIPILLDIPATKRFVSIEPCLSSVDLCVPHSQGIGELLIDGLDWVILGAETGPGARLMDPQWARAVRNQCREAGVPLFMKQMSKREPIPEDLMVREFPS